MPVSNANDLLFLDSVQMHVTDERLCHTYASRVLGGELVGETGPHLAALQTPYKHHKLKQIIVALVVLSLIHI